MPTQTPKQVSERMKRIKGKDTAPELIVRSLCHRLGYRFRLHMKELPGSPDLVFPRLKKVIFVHGCFWHRHGNGCRKSTMPAVNIAFWNKKFDSNLIRDRRAQRQLRRLGWSVKVVWECQTTDAEGLAIRLSTFLLSKC
ncbi:MAG: DNA mismatch endonuclease Vsr [Geothrix sp.]|uniref:very short patch repair endonuclease n=1 Tax=Geothrix sp. TaxID=1962974 RepID=UPI0017C8C89D|nr:DNA mismatch endonuclease Vsr [Geothrix sp.]